MKFLKYIIAVSLFAILGHLRLDACGVYSPGRPDHIRIFRSCSPELSRQWQEGCRFQDYEKEQNCLLWQKITSPSIPYNDIEKMVYSAHLSDLKGLPAGKHADNKFAQWLSKPEHREDLEYLLVAKEIEELREYINDGWYYAYDSDDEHIRLKELAAKCRAYKGKRHTARYALQLVRLHFVDKDYKSCIDLWEKSVGKMPKDIVTDMVASYVGGAYSRMGNREKAIALFTRSQDIGSLINLKAWDVAGHRSKYTDTRIRELEYIFEHFPNSPLLGIRLQEYVRNREDFVYDFADWKDRNFHGPVGVKYYRDGDSLVADDEHAFYDELKIFANRAATSVKCRQKGMWHYALGYLHYLDGNMKMAQRYLIRAENSEATPLIKESIHAFRFLLDAHTANLDNAYRSRLLKHLKWLDGRMAEDANPDYTETWQYSNNLNYPTTYWQDVARRVLLGEACPRLLKSGDTTLALQLANYATNRIHQISPYFKAYHYGLDENDDPESYHSVITFDEYRKTWPDHNWFDYSSQFFNMISNVKADQAALYAERIVDPHDDMERFLNERGYVDTDYINDIVATLYLREMRYGKAVEWLSKVSKDYQARTNVAKDGYFNLDPFKYQTDKKQYIADSRDYKLRFAKEMSRLEKIFSTTTDPNKKSESKIRYAIGLRNSFDKCWYLTGFGCSMDDSTDTVPYNTLQAYKRADTLMDEGIAGFTDPERAAKAQLEMMNYATLMKKYPKTKAAAAIRTRCDHYHDYALHKR